MMLAIMITLLQLLKKDYNTKKYTSKIININTASVSDLTNLSGIGEVKAKSIVNYRNKNGKFKNNK
ncbi:MAG: helix-hairpin-helix domain-containing protein [Clostridium sp.]|nr:MAG: helix-hairpin-helix domain-containing protein [Clostridium sp.]